MSSVDLGCQNFHRADEVAPGILAPGVVLVDAGIAGHVFLFRQHVAGRRDVIHGGVRADAEHVIARLLLEDARRAAIVEHGERLEFFRHRRHRQAVSRRHVADHGVDLVALHQVAKFGDHIGGGAGLVDIFRFDLAPPIPTLLKGAGALPALSASMTISAALRPGMPNGDAAGPVRNVTIPSFTGAAAGAAGCCA